MSVTETLADEMATEGVMVGTAETGAVMDAIEGTSTGTATIGVIGIETVSVIPQEIENEKGVAEVEVLPESETIRKQSERHSVQVRWPVLRRLAGRHPRQRRRERKPRLLSSKQREKEWSSLRRSPEVSHRHVVDVVTPVAHRPLP
jgi:hypothetical protein